MPVFMDVHNVEGGVSAADVAGAHEADLATQRRPTRCTGRLTGSSLTRSRSLNDAGQTAS
jgi:hypothetical protein